MGTSAERQVLAWVPWLPQRPKTQIGVSALREKEPCVSKGEKRRKWLQQEEHRRRLQLRIWQAAALYELLVILEHFLRR
jgi:hypothetical protein